MFMVLKFIILTFLFISINLQCREIKVVTEYLSPFQIKKVDGSLGGFSTEIIHELFKLTDDTANITVMPWARAYKIAQSERNVLIFSIARTKHREDKFNWIGTLMRQKYYFWGVKERFPKNQYSMNELMPLNIATIRNTNRHEYLLSNNFKKIHSLIHEEQQIKMLYENRTDLVIEAELSLFEMIKRYGISADSIKKVAEIPELDAQLSVAFSKGTSAHLIKKYSDAFKALEKNGTILNLKLKWGIPSEEQINSAL